MVSISGTQHRSCTDNCLLTSVCQRRSCWPLITKSSQKNTTQSSKCFNSLKRISIPWTEQYFKRRNITTYYSLFRCNFWGEFSKSFRVGLYVADFNEAVRRKSWQKCYRGFIYHHDKKQLKAISFQKTFQCFWEKNELLFVYVLWCLFVCFSPIISSCKIWQHFVSNFKCNILNYSR